MSHNKSRNTCNTERGKSWSMKVPRAPIRPALQGHKPSTHSLRTLERKPGYGRKSTGSVMQVTSLDAFWSPGAHCALAVPWALFSSQYSSTTSISSETLEMVLALEHNSPQTLILKKVIFMKAENPNCLDPKYLMTPKEQSPPPYRCRICVDGPVKRGAWVDLKSL